MQENKTALENDGFTTFNEIYTQNEVDDLIRVIENAETNQPTFRKSEHLFAIRQFLKEVPAAIPVIFNDTLKRIITQLLGDNVFIVKSLYFDKPEQSNWFVAYHQDLTISVDQRTDFPGYGPWTIKQNQFAVQPPLEILESIYTIRIHLDDTDENNGALKVIPGSHNKGIYRPENIEWEEEVEVSCNVPEGGVMIMRPLLFHSSGRTVNKQKRRVIHIEFSNSMLPHGLKWAEYLELKSKSLESFYI